MGKLYLFTSKGREGGEGGQRGKGEGKGFTQLYFTTNM